MSPRAAGARSELVEHRVEERWLRAYAAAVGDLSPPLFDPDAPAGIVAHPVFPACLEWPLVRAGPPGYDLTPEAAHAGLHVSHEIAWHRPIRPGGELRTTVALKSVRERSIGTFVEFAFATTTADDEPVVETRQGILYRGTELTEPEGQGYRGEAPVDEESRGKARADAADRPPEAPLEPVAGFQVEEADAILYTECARIWNPIHTDPRAARAAGLPTTIYHGTATLARIVSALVAHRLGGDPTRVRRLGCRFTAPVAPGDLVTITASDSGGAAAETLVFGAEGADGTTLVDRGFLELARAR